MTVLLVLELLYFAEGCIFVAIKLLRSTIPYT